MSEKKKLRFEPHPDDRGIDEILFCPEMVDSYEQAAASAFLRLSIRERYKTSGLSGDEWRFSTMLWLREKPNQPWVETSSGYRDLQTHAGFLYSELFSDFRADEKHRWLYRRKVANVCFSWKRLPVSAGSYDGDAMDLLVTCGHLPNAYVMAGENGEHHHGALSHLCCQPGCVEPLVSIYKKLRDYCRFCGRPHEPNRLIGDKHRGFCRKHLRRGDCGLDDADDNYEVVSGPGPNGNEPDESVVSKSAFGGFVDMGRL